MDRHEETLEINTESLSGESSISDTESEFETQSNNYLGIQINNEIPMISIYEIPESITTKKPEAYKPQLIGIGLHHVPETTRGQKTKMEETKLVVVQTILQQYKIKDFKLSVIDKVQKVIPTIRECYEMLLKEDDESLAKDLAIDGLFLLNLFNSYHRNSHRDRLLAKDLLMMENQIPLMVLKEIHKALHPSSPDETFSSDIFRSFTENHSPFELWPSFEASMGHRHHLLDYMYKLIILNDRRIPKPIPKAPPIVNATNFVENVPQREIVQLYQKIITSLKEFSERNMTNASASKLKGIAGVTFKHLPDRKRIADITFEENCLYLPCITLNDHSEVILRNLVAYETLSSLKFPLSKCIRLMCWLVADVEDVKILKEVNIIKSDLDNELIVKIFVEMSSCIESMETEVKSKLQEMVNKLNVGLVLTEFTGGER